MQCVTMVMFMYTQCCVTMVMTPIYIGEVYYVAVFLNQARSGQRPARAWFLKITSVRMCVCVSAPRAIKNYSREMKSE